MAQYSFPILENDELLPCMEEMEIPLTAALLAKPTYEVVGPLFEGVLIGLTGITRWVNTCLYHAEELSESHYRSPQLWRSANSHTCVVKTALAAFALC